MRLDDKRGSGAARNPIPRYCVRSLSLVTSINQIGQVSETVGLGRKCLRGGNMQTTLRRSRLQSRRAVGSSFQEAHNRKWMSSVAVQALDQLAVGVIVTNSGAGVVEMN